MKKEIIEQWKRDMLDKEFPRFNMDYEIIEHPKREYEGDAALFLAYRHVNAHDLSAWYADKRSYEIITMFTDIPLKDARALLNPPDGDGVDYTYIKPKDFIQVLDLYLETGMVAWPKHYLVPPPKRAPRIKTLGESSAA